MNSIQDFENQELIEMQERLNELGYKIIPILQDDKKIEIGKAIADLLDLKKKGNLILTSKGKKTLLGLFETIDAILNGILNTQEKKPEPEIVITIEGGILDEVYTNIPNLKINTIDYDVLSGEGLNREERETKLKEATQHLNYKH